MPNIAQIFKDEILRLARKEIKAATENFNNTVRDLKHQNVLLKKEIAGLTEQLATLQIQRKTITANPAKEANRPDKRRLGAAGIRKLRSRLDLNRQEMALLLGVNPNSIFLWERSKAKPRPATREKIIALRSMSKDRVESILAELPAKGS